MNKIIKNTAIALGVTAGAAVGLPLDEIYTNIDETPIGSASIGQVYTGKLRKNGKKVAIKVQKPNIEETIKSDLKIMKFLAGATIVISVPTMISSFLGMNVPLGELANNPFSALGIFIASVVISVIVAIILYKKNML